MGTSKSEKLTFRIAVYAGVVKHNQQAIGGPYCMLMQILQ